MTRLIIVALGVLAAAQSAPPSAVSKPVPRTVDGKPDLSGVWEHPYVPDMTKTTKNQRGTADLPFSPAGLKDWQSYDAANGDYTGSCLPYGMARSFNAPYPVQILQTRDHVAFLFELNTWFHVVPTDGQRPPADPDPTWFGTSAGRWEGDTLVVETVGFNGYTRLDTVGHPHSSRLHLVQRFQRTDLDHITYTMTVDDPEYYTKPWSNERTFTRMDGGLIEYSCEENNKDLREGHIKAWTLPEPKKKGG